MMKKPRIKFNGGNPVALCDECSVITEYITYNEDDTLLSKVLKKKYLCIVKNALKLKQ